MTQDLPLAENLSKYYLIKNNLNQSSYWNPALHHFGCAGGEKKLCENLNQISQNRIRNISPGLGRIMVDLAYELEHVNRLNYPIVLDPKEASFIDVAVHAHLRQRLSTETIKKRIS